MGFWDNLGKNLDAGADASQGVFRSDLLLKETKYGAMAKLDKWKKDLSEKEFRYVTYALQDRSEDRSFANADLAGELAEYAKTL